MNRIRIWLTDLLRPKICSVKVVVYQNEKELDIRCLEPFRLHALAESINALWNKNNTCSYWFETEIFEQKGCFHKAQPYLLLTCYKDNTKSRSLKSPVGIPISYRKKFFDITHVVHAAPTSTNASHKTYIVRFIAIR